MNETMNGTVHIVSLYILFMIAKFFFHLQEHMQTYFSQSSPNIIFLFAWHCIQHEMLVHQ